VEVKRLADPEKQPLHYDSTGASRTKKEKRKRNRRERKTETKTLCPARNPCSASMFSGY